VDGDFGTVDAVVITDGTAEVYNLTVDEAHTYFVGDGAWLVHNACPPPTRSQVRAAADLGMDRETRRQFFEGKYVHIVRPPINTGALPTDVFMRLESGRLRSLIFSVVDETGSGQAPFRDYLRQTNQFAQILGVNEVEIGGMSVLNQAIDNGLTDRGFTVHYNQPAPEFLPDEPVTIISKIIQLK
jgi:hypothetical protein